MTAILPSVKIDRTSYFAQYFMPHQLAWILAEDEFHAQKKQVFALAEKSVRIGWTYADAFKNIRKRLNFPNRDYLFATKDYPSALEYMRLARQFLELFHRTRSIISYGEDYLKLNRSDSDGRAKGITEEIKISYIKFDNRSRIIAFSAHPQAMAVYGGDVGLDEFAKHPNAELLWQTAQGRVTWAYDLAVWSSHEGDDTLFHQFALQARLLSPSSSSSSSLPPLNSQLSTLNPPIDYCSRCDRPIPPFVNGERPTHCDCGAPIPLHLQTPSPDHNLAPPTHPLSDPPTHSDSAPAPINPVNPINSPWNLYFRVTITDAIQLGLLDTINRTRNAALTPDQFLADCRARAGLEQIFQQAYLCNPVPGGASIVEWSTIERCRSDYEIERVHLEADQIRLQFGEFSPGNESARESKIENFLRDSFPTLFRSLSPSHGERAGERGRRSINHQPSTINFRLGFDVAASGQGDLAAIYIDEAKADDLWLRALFTCRTEDWHFLKTVLFFFLEKLPRLQAAGDETGLGRQICWEAASRFSYKFTKVSFSAKKHDLGFALMNQLATAQKRFPQNQQDIAADYFALRKSFAGSKWAFSEGRNSANPASHCDIAWAGALASHAHTEERCEVSAAVCYDDRPTHGGSYPILPLRHR